MAVPAAELFVKVTGDISDASKKLGQIGSTAEKTGGILKGAVGTALGFGAATIGLNALGGAMGALKGGAIDMNAQLETSTLQFTTLMGDSDKAKKHVESLFDFAAKTPFETGPIIQASRTMQTFGGDALNTKKNLTLFGDAAAATSNNIDEVGFWMSRAYAAIKGGQPFGEARMRLMEMGIITPQVASKMEELQKSGASADKIWGQMTGTLGKFSGAMETQSGTFSGMLSTFTDGVNMALAQGFKPLFDGMKGGLKVVNEFMASPMFQGAMTGIASGIAAAFGVIGDAVSTAWTVVQPIFGLIGTFITGMQTGATGLGTSFDGLGEKMATFAQGIYSGIGSLIEQVVPQFATLAGKAVDWIIAALPGLLSNLATYMTTMLGYFIDALPGIVAKLAEWGAALIGWVIPRIPQILGALAGFLGKIGGWFMGTALPKIVGMAGDLGIGLVNGFLKFVIGPPGLLEKIATFITGTLIPGIITWGPKLLGAAGDIARSFIRGFIDALGSLPGKIADVVRRAFAGLRIDVGPFHISGSGVTVDLPSIPGFAVGSANVPRDMLAMVHKGEMIIPADLAERIRGGGGSVGMAGGNVLAAGGGGTLIVLNIGDFHGTEDNITQLSQRLGEVVRYGTLRRNPGG